MKFFLLYLVSSVLSGIYFWLEFTKISWNPKLDFLLASHLLITICIFLSSYLFLFQQRRAAQFNSFFFLLLILIFWFYDSPLSKKQEIIYSHSQSIIIGFYFLSLTFCFLSLIYSILLGFHLWKKFPFNSENFPIQEKWIMSKIIIFASFVVCYGLISFFVLFLDEKILVTYSANITYSDDSNFFIVRDEFLLPFPFIEHSEYQKNSFLATFEINLDFRRIRKVHLWKLSNLPKFSSDEKNLCLTSPKFCEFLQKELNHVRIHN